MKKKKMGCHDGIERMILGSAVEFENATQQLHFYSNTNYPWDSSDVQHSGSYFARLLWLGESSKVMNSGKKEKCYNEALSEGITQH